MAKAQKYSLINCFSINITILSTFGLYLPRIQSNRQKLLNNCSMFIVLFFFVILFVFLMFSYVFLHSNDLETLADQLFLSTTIYISIIKVLCIAVKKNELNALVSSLDDDIFYPENKIHLKHFEFGKRLFYRTRRFFFVMSLVGFLPILFSPVIDLIVVGKKQEIIRLPLEMWYPFDIENHFIYAAVYAYQLIIMMILFWVIIAIDTFLYGFLSLAIGQLCILNSALRNLTANKKKSENTTENNEIDHWKALAHCVNHYESIVVYVFF